MAIFCITCLDKPNGLEERMRVRPDHLVYLKSHEDIIRLAGAQLDAEGKMCGSMLLIEVEDLAAAEAFAANDPFNKEGVFAQVTVRGYNAGMGSWKPA